MTPTWTKAGLVGLGTGLLLGLWLARGRPVDPVVLHRIDTVLVDSTASRRVRDSLQQVAISAINRSKLAINEAQRLRRVADSMAHSAIQPAIDRPIDSVTTDTASISMVPQSAYHTLASAYDSLQVAYQAQVEATASLRAEVTLGEQRIGALERTLGEARTELLKTRTPSRWGLGCAGGYGASLMGGVVHASPAIACGVTFRIK